MKKLYSFLIVGILCLSIATALTIKYYYSPSCPYCQKTSPIVQKIINQFPEHNWEIYNIQETNNPYSSGVPTIIIDEEMIIVGSKDIFARLKCEVQQMTTKECPTLSADRCIGNGESWFII